MLYYRNTFNRLAFLFSLSRFDWATFSHSLLSCRVKVAFFHLQEFCNEEPFVIYLLKISLKCILALILLTLQRKCLEKSAAEWLGVKYVW